MTGLNWYIFSQINAARDKMLWLLYNIISFKFVFSVCWSVLLIYTTNLMIKRNKITKYYIFTPTYGLEGFDRIIDKMKDIPAYIATLLFPTSLFIDAMLCISKSQILGFIKYQLFSYIAFIAGVTLLSIFKYVNMKFPNAYRSSSSTTRKSSDYGRSSSNRYWSDYRRNHR